MTPRRNNNPHETSAQSALLKGDGGAGESGAFVACMRRQHAPSRRHQAAAHLLRSANIAQNSVGVKHHSRRVRNGGSMARRGAKIKCIQKREIRRMAAIPANGKRYCFSGKPSVEKKISRDSWEKSTIREILCYTQSLIYSIYISLHISFSLRLSAIRLFSCNGILPGSFCRRKEMSKACLCTSKYIVANAIITWNLSPGESALIIIASVKLSVSGAKLCSYIGGDEEYKNMSERRNWRWHAAPWRSVYFNGKAQKRNSKYQAIMKSELSTLYERKFSLFQPRRKAKAKKK